MRGVVGLLRDRGSGLRELQKESVGEATGKRTIEGDSPVSKTESSPEKFPSRTRPEKPRLNLGAPSSKAKYYSATDSELVP